MLVFKCTRAKYVTVWNFEHQNHIETQITWIEECKAKASWTTTVSKVISPRAKPGRTRIYTWGPRGPIWHTRIKTPLIHKGWLWSHVHATQGGYGPLRPLQTLLASTARAWRVPPKNCNLPSFRCEERWTIISPSVIQTALHRRTHNTLHRWTHNTLHRWTQKQSPQTNTQHSTDEHTHSPERNTKTLSTDKHTTLSTDEHTHHRQTHIFHRQTHNTLHRQTHNRAQCVRTGQ